MHWPLQCRWVWVLLGSAYLHNALSGPLESTFKRAAFSSLRRIDMFRKTITWLFGALLLSAGAATAHSQQGPPPSKPPQAPPTEPQKPPHGPQTPKPPGGPRQPTATMWTAAAPSSSTNATTTAFSKWTTYATVRTTSYLFTLPDEGCFSWSCNG